MVPLLCPPDTLTRAALLPWVMPPLYVTAAVPPLTLNAAPEAPLIDMGVAAVPNVNVPVALVSDTPAPLVLLIDRTSNVPPAMPLPAMPAPLELTTENPLTVL